MKKLTTPLAVALGCAGAAVAAPFLAPYLVTASLPFFGTVLAGVLNAEEFRKKLGEVVGNTAAGFLTEIGGSAIDKLPGTLGAEHNFHLEKMLATAYLESLETAGEEIDAGRDDELKGQAAQVIPALTDRIAGGLRGRDLSPLFPLGSEHRPAAAAFANRFSAEEVSLLLADEQRWRERLGDEVEIALRRWLGEARAGEARARGRTQLGLSPDAPLREPLRGHLRTTLPHRIAHRVGELAKRDDFKESWIAFQRAHLQGMLVVLGRIEGSQAEIKESVDALSRRIEGFAGQDELVAAVGDKLGEFLRESHLPPDELARLLERQSGELIAELRGVEQRLGGKIDESRAEIVGEIRGAKDELKAEIQQAILQSAARAARNRLRQLPAPPRDFTGRAAELDELRAALGRGGVTISGVQGMGGVGKTALALVLAHEFRDRYPDAQIFLDLKGVGPQPLTPADVMWHVVNSFQPDVKRPDDDQLPAWYNALLNDNRVLLFYDNAANAEQIEPLLPPANCLLLVTSRNHFKVAGMFDTDLNRMTEADAAALLLEIAPRIAGDAAAVARQCGHLPLALRLAASALNKSRALTPTDLVRRLQDRRRRVELVEASFGLSYDLLTAEQQTRWRTLAIFPGDFDAPAAAALWQTDADAARDALAELEEYSLLEWAEATRRYTLHDLARDYAHTRLSDSEREQAGLRYAAYYLQILSTATDLFEKGGEAIAEGLSLFDKERVNIEVGQAWAASRFAGDERAAQLCNEYPNAGIYVLHLRQHPRNFSRWLEAARSSARQLGDRAAEGRHLINLGAAYRNLGEARRAIEFCEQALVIHREIGDRRAEGSALGSLGNAYADLGEVRRAIEFYEQRLIIARELSDRRGESNALGNLGVAYAELGEVRRAIEFYEQNLVIHREIGDHQGEGQDLSNLGTAYRKLGEVRRAVAFYEQALVIHREVGDRRGEGTALGNLGQAYLYLGDPEKAVGVMEEALKIFEEIESPHANTVRGWLESLRGGGE